MHGSDLWTHGTKNLYGFSIGVLVIEGYFPRLPGAIGNAATFPFPVLHKIVPGATGTKTVREVADLDPDDPQYRHAVDPWLEAARSLEREGVSAITTSCGFAALFQKEMADTVDIPVFATSLLLVPIIHRMLDSSKKVGVLTADSRMLKHRHLLAVGADPQSIAVRGLEGSTTFEEMAYHDRHDLNVSALERDIVDQVDKLTAENEVGAIVLECGLFPPFASAVQRASDLPVFDNTNLVKMMHDCLHRRPFPQGFETSGYCI